MDNCTHTDHIRMGPRPDDPVERERVVNRILEHLQRKEEPMLRAKMRVSEVAQIKNADGSINMERVKLCAVYDSNPETENGKWSKWTPSANLDIQINNPDAFNQLSSGHEYFVDFTPAK